jgi:hypothetical protein
MNRMRRLSVLAITLLAAKALGHVAPSVDVNNRYLKLTPGADRVRLAYTVFFGHTPGAAARKMIDGNRDGTIDDREAQPFGERVGAEVAGALELVVDGKRQPVSWTAVSVGMGTPATQGGAFSVDLIATLCVEQPTGSHTLELRDGYRLPIPGETELVIDDSPGITNQSLSIGGRAIPELSLKFVGPGGPLADQGARVTFTITERAPRGPRAGCPDPKPVDRAGYLALYVSLVGLVTVGTVAALIWRRRRETPTKA